MSKAILEMSWPWPLLTYLIDTVIPGDIVTVGAGTGVGKTTFVTNLLDHCARQAGGITLVATEMTRARIINGYAAQRLGVSEGDVNRERWHVLPAGTREKVDQVRMSFETGWHRRIRIPELMNPTGADIRRAMEQSAESGRHVFLLDHVHHVRLPGRTQKNLELERLLADLKTWAEQLRFIVILAAQFNRGERDGGDKFDRPELGWFMGSSKLEQISSVCLGLYKPVRAGVTPDQRRLVKLGQLDEHDIIEPGTIACVVMKHRERGARVVGRTIFFRFERGRLVVRPAPRAQSDGQRFVEQVEMQNAAREERERQAAADAAREATRDSVQHELDVGTGSTSARFAAQAANALTPGCGSGAKGTARASRALSSV